MILVVSSNKRTLQAAVANPRSNLEGSKSLSNVQINCDLGPNFAWPGQ